MNTFGQIFRFTSFGESHGAALGGIIDGIPAGVLVDTEFIHSELRRRATGSRTCSDKTKADADYPRPECTGSRTCSDKTKTDADYPQPECTGSRTCSDKTKADADYPRPECTGSRTCSDKTKTDGNNTDGSTYSSSRKESDTVEILSGVFEGRTLGTPIGFIIRNEDNRSEDYTELQHLFRPAHADDTYFHKYKTRDYRGGGRASARETAVRVAVGAFAKMMLRQYGTKSSNGGITVEAKIVETGDIAQARIAGDSAGGIIECVAKGVPRSLGEPLYDKLSARLAYAMMSIPASRSFEIGKGIEAARMYGSEHNDRWNADGTTENNYAGGVRGGISTGEDIVLRVGFKPIPSISKKQILLSDKGELVQHSIRGRHDVTCVFRALPVVEAMTAITLADFVLLKSAYVNRVNALKF